MMFHLELNSDSTVRFELIVFFSLDLFSLVGLVVHLLMKNDHNTEKILYLLLRYASGGVTCTGECCLLLDHVNWLSVSLCLGTFHYSSCRFALC
jgi:hypothetical protein